jgi:hypothetical protein
MDISDSTLWSSSKSLRKLAQEEDIGLATAHKAVREILNIFPYEITAVYTPVDITSNTFQKCTANLRTHSIICLIYRRPTYLQILT